MKLHACYVGWFGRKLNFASIPTDWGCIYMLVLGPFCIFLDWVRG